MRIGVFERAWFKTFRINVHERIDYPKDLGSRVNEIPYFMALLDEECSNEYSSELEKRYLDEFKYMVEGRRNILSIGCGCGRDLRLIGRNELGVDIFPSNIILADSQGVLAILADARELPFRDNSFDALLAVQSLEYIPISDTSNLLNELHRVLKPGGIILLTLEKCSDDVDREFSYEYRNDYLAVKHFHRCWGIRGLREIGKYFNIIKLNKDNDYYYILVIKQDAYIYG